MKLKYLPLVGALMAAAPAFAISVNMTDFSFASPPQVDTTDTANNYSFSGEAGRFNGTLTDTPAAAALASATNDATASFTAYCAELTQNFYFNTTYNYSWVDGNTYFGAQKAADLSRLFTATGQAGFVVDGATSAAMQAAIWEIIYETQPTYSLIGGTFMASPHDPSYASAFSTVNGFLANLAGYSSTGYQINVLTNELQQDFLVATPVPEPGTWALLAGGLGVIGLMARRRRKA